MLERTIAIGAARQRGAVAEKEAMTLYRQHAVHLRERILQGLYSIGTSLPSEAALREEFLVSRHTVRAALQQLKEEGLVVSHRGSGTQVIPPAAREQDTHQVMSVNDLIAFAGDAEFEAREILVQKLDEARQQQIGLNKHSAWLQLRGLRSGKTDKTPQCWTEYFIHKDYASMARILTRHRGPVFPLLEDMFNLDVTEVEQQISATMVGETLASLLDVEPGTAALEVRRRYKTGTGKLVQVTVNTHPASRFKQSMTMRRVKAGERAQT